MNVGTCGRLAYMKSLFLGIKGYDVQFLPMGCQDIDIKRRLGPNVFDVKGDMVGISLPNAKLTGDKDKDSPYPGTDKGGRRVP